MFDLDIRRSHLEWEAIAPYIGCLYQEYLMPEFQTWAHEMWVRLREFDLTRAHTQLDTLDSLVRAINLFDLHRMVVYYLGNFSLDMGMRESLINMVDKEDLKKLAAVRYHLPYEDICMMDESVSSAIGRLYMCQIPATIRALYFSYDSPELMHEHILEHSVLPYRPNDPLSNTYTGAAEEYIQRIANKDDFPRNVDEFSSSDRIH